MSEQRTTLRLRLEVRALEYQLTAAREWLTVQTDEVYRLRARVHILETQAELARGDNSG